MAGTARRGDAVRRGKLAVTRSWVLVRAWPVSRWVAVMIAGTRMGDRTIIRMRAGSNMVHLGFSAKRYSRDKLWDLTIRTGGIESLGSW